MKNLAEYHQITFDEYLTAKQEIKEELLNMAGSFIRIGYRLKQIKESGAYRNDGYQTLAEFAKTEYGLSESAASRFMAVNTKFSVGGNSPELLPEFKNFGSGKLSEMLTLSNEDCQLIKETTTVATIREVKRFNKGEKVEADVVTEAEDTKKIDGLATSQETGIKFVIVEFFRDKKELLNNIYKLENFEEIAEMINPSGNLTFKKGLYMLFFYSYSEGVALKTFGKPNKTYTWPEFIKLIADIFWATYTVPGKIWENFYRAKETQENVEQEKAEQAQEKITKSEDLETCDVARKNKENIDFQKEGQRVKEGTESPEQAEKNNGLEKTDNDSEQIEEQAEIEEYFDENGDYQVPEEKPEDSSLKFCIRNIAGKVRFYDDNIELINGECIDEIMWQIENKLVQR